MNQDLLDSARQICVLIGIDYTYYNVMSVGEA